MQKPKILHSEICAKSKLFKIEKLDLEFSNGTLSQYEIVRGSSNGAVLIVAVKADLTVLLISEYAAGLDRYELALPKGKIDSGETILEAANRELKEETGFGAHKLEHITSYSIAPSYFTHVTHVVLAQDLYECKLQGDEPEEIITSTWSLHELSKLFARSDMTEARSIATLYHVRDLLC